MTTITRALTILMITLAISPACVRQYDYKGFEVRVSRFPPLDAQTEHLDLDDEEGTRGVSRVNPTPSVDATILEGLQIHVMDSGQAARSTN